MKKIALILAALLVFSFVFVACNNDEGDNNSDKKNPPVIDDGTTDGEENTTTNDGGNQDEEKTYTFTRLETPETVYAFVNVNLREAPSFAATVATKSVPTGTALTKVGESNESDKDSQGDEYKWFIVTFEEKEYYVKSTLITTLADPEAGFVAIEKTLYINTESLKVRSIPSWESLSTADLIIEYLSKGKEIKIVAENTTDGWYKIELKAATETTPAKYGYVSSNAKWFSDKPIVEDKT